MPKKGSVVAICVAKNKGEPLEEVAEVLALEGQGLEGDRYARGEGSWSKTEPEKRPVTLINSAFIKGSGFTHAETRRSIATEGIELMTLIGRDFAIGEAVLHGAEYCEPCLRPSALAGKKERFNEIFHDRAGIRAKVIKTGRIKKGDTISLL